jgi:hypothetical protein
MSPYPVRRFTVDEYHQIIQTGILTEDDPVELLEEWIVQKLPRGPLHDGTMELANATIRRRLTENWGIRTHSGITTEDSEPEPDLAIVRGDARRYMAHHPGPPDVGLLIEVAHASLDRDRTVKGRLYARAGIVCYWVINLVDRQVEVYTDPSGPDANPSYRQRRDYGIQNSVPLVLDGQELGEIPVRDLVP